MILAVRKTSRRWPKVRPPHEKVSPLLHQHVLIDICAIARGATIRDDIATLAPADIMRDAIFDGAPAEYSCRRAAVRAACILHQLGRDLVGTLDGGGISHAAASVLRFLRPLPPDPHHSVGLFPELDDRMWRLRYSNTPGIALPWVARYFSAAEIVIELDCDQ